MSGESMATSKSPDVTVSDAIKKLVSFLGDAKTIIGVAIGVVAAIFFAGAYYHDASETIVLYKKKIEQTEKDIQLLRAQLQKMENASGRIATKATDGAFAGEGSVEGYA